MRKKRNDFDAVGVERMTDAELSKKLGGYQRTEHRHIAGRFTGDRRGVFQCLYSMTPFLVCALAFPRRGTVPVGGKARPNEEKSLMQQQLGSFFRTELTKSLRSEPELATLPIDWAYLAAKASAVPFTECTLTIFTRASTRGCGSPPPTMELRRTVEEKSGPNNDNWMT